jgi:Na+-transporting NADH:ubiquinone oxidoreductase subunit F
MYNILITVAVITGITAVLAFILTWADVRIADYGERKIIINNDKELIVEGGSSLLSSLISNEIFIPSACGGKGTCGYCKCKVDSGAGPVLATELSYLSENDLKNNIRLSCQVKVKEDMNIKIPEELFNVKQFKGVIDIAKDITPTIKFLRIKITDKQEINFKAGQYVQLLAPPYGDSTEEVFRAYSIASSTSEKSFIDLIIGYVDGGILTTYVHKHLSEGDKVTFNGPYGDFYLQESESDVVLVAVGTGMAPIRSILYEMLHNKIDRNTIFFFGAKTKDDLFLLDEMIMFENELPRFRFIPCLSRPQEEDNWQGYVGRVNNAISKYLEKKEGSEAYLCGSAPMIDSTVNALTDKGIPEAKIFYDKFD